MSATSQLQIYVEAIRAQLEAADICGGKVTRDPFRPSQRDDLDEARVFFTSDRAAAAHSPRVTYPRFNHSSTIVVEIIAKRDDGAELKDYLDGQAGAVMRSVLTNLAWGKAVEDGLGTEIDGIDSVNTVFDMPPDGDAVIGRVQVQFSVLWYSEWLPPSDPTLPDCAGVGLTVSQPAGTTPPGVLIAVPTA